MTKLAKQSKKRDSYINMYYKATVIKKFHTDKGLGRQTTGTEWRNQETLLHFYVYTQ